MQKIIQSKKKWIFILSILTTISISIQVVNGIFTFNGNDFKWVILAIMLYVLFDKALDKYNKRLAVCSRNI